MLWQTETMWMHTADNDFIVCLFHADLITLLYAIIQSQFTDLFNSEIPSLEIIWMMGTG